MRLADIRVADGDKNIASSEIQLTLQVSESVHVYLLYNARTMYQHNEKRPWIFNEGWAQSDLLTGHSGNINFNSPDCIGNSLNGLRVKTFPAGTINIMGNNGQGENGPLIFVMKAGDIYRCDCCLETKPYNEYDELILRTKTKRKLLCFRCQRFGFSCKDFTKYSCACNHWPLGHLLFRRRDLDNWKRGKSATLKCQICVKDDPHQRNKEPDAKFQCKVCGSIATGLEAFDKSILFNHRVHGRELLCKDCQKRGLTAVDSDRYFCRICECEGGSLHFNRMSLKNFKYRQLISPICKTCWATGDKLLQLLRRKDAWRCKCNIY